LADTNWITIGASILGGGAAGAVINSVVSAWRNRKQTIAYRIEIDPLFRGSDFLADVRASLTLYSPTGGYAQEIPSLFVVNIEVVNRGNKDYSSFNLGFTLSEHDSAVYCVPSSSDRHRQARVVTVLGPGAPVREIDCLLVPFNRMDRYKFNLYVVAEHGAQVPGDIKLGSTEPIVFSEAPTVTEVAVEAAKIALKLGPLKISVG
jgi:hypothetical protein